jgi:hypothetical protein
MKFLQLSRFGLYLILTEEKKVKKFERGLDSRIQIMMSCFNIRDFSQLVDRASIYEQILKENAAEYADQKRRLIKLVLWSKELGQLREWRWGVFHPRGHKNVPLVTLWFRHRGIRRRSYARSVTVYTGDPTGW